MADTSMTSGSNLAELDFEPVFTTEEAEQAEEANNEASRARRIALVLLTQSKADMMDMVKKDPETAINMAEMLGDGITRNDMIREQLEMAFARLCCAASTELDIELN